MKNYLPLALLCTLLFSPPAPGQRAVPTLHIDAATVTAQVSPRLYGFMTEEINNSYDGGLYAELIQNRIFKDDGQKPVHWSLVQEGGGAGAMSLETQQALNAALDISLKLEAKSVKAAQRVGVANDGYWGIAVKPKTRYRASFYAKAAEGFAGPLTVSIESTDGAAVFAHAEVPKITSAWQKYEAELTTGDVPLSLKNQFVLSMKQPGTVWFTLVSLFPPTWQDRPNGNRIDLMHRLIELKPAFLRFPGGNYLEGDTIETRFDWKKTLHDLAQRPGHQGPWNYRSSDGMGLLEFLEWAEDLHAEPLLGIYAGYSLKQQFVPPGPKLQPYVQDALDEIEYITGDPATKWGAQRAGDGHPEPFPLRYVEIGNEDEMDQSGTYSARFAQFYDAIKAKYPQLQLIATMHVQSKRPDLVDEHYYHIAGDMEKLVHQFDRYDRHAPKIFVGEWATTEGSPTPHLHASLADAAWMTGLERNSDVVALACYAPLLVNVSPARSNAGTNLIGYDGLTNYGSPSYYIQKMFSNYLGDVVVKSSLEDAPLSPEGNDQLFYSVTKDSKSGRLYLKLVYNGVLPQDLRIDLSGAANVAPEGISVVLSSAEKLDTNSLTEPEKIVPVTTREKNFASSFTRTLPPHSVTVLQLYTK